MNSSMIYELLGYLASILVAVSLMMRSVLKLRLINLAGAVCFTIYGLVIRAYPVAGVNAFITLINIYYLYEMTSAKAYFTILESQHDSAYLRAFLQFYQQDIATFFPDFRYTPAPQQLIWFILRDLVPVGLFIAEPSSGKGLRVILDYVIPGYRDLQPGTFLYTRQADRFRARGIEHIDVIPGTKLHQRYVQRMGFEPVEAAENQMLYRRAVK